MDCCEKGVYAIKKGNQVGIYCAECNEWLRWANKKERKMIGNGEIKLRDREEKI